MMVKVCGITNQEDAAAAAAAGASALGFIFYPKSPRYITPEHAAGLFSALPPRVWKVGVFVNEPPDKVVEVARRISLDVVQLHGETPLPQGLRVWKALPAEVTLDSTQLERWAAEAFLIDTPAAGDAYGGTGRTFDWRRVAALPGRIILAGGLDAGNVAAAIRAARPWGVDACSRLETAPGKKDHARVAAFIQAAFAAAGEPGEAGHEPQEPL